MHQRAVTGIALLGLAVVAVAAAETRPGGEIGATAARAKRAGLAFSVSGTARGIVPGRGQRIDYSILNRRRFGIVVTSVSVVARSTRDGCSGRNLVAPGWRGRVRVRARSRARLRWWVGMRADAPDACQGATFLLKFRGRARRAPR